MSAPPTVELTTRQLVLVGASGGAAALLTLALALAVGLGVYLLADRITRITRQQRDRRALLRTCQAIHDLPATRHPTEDPR